MTMQPDAPTRDQEQKEEIKVAASLTAAVPKERPLPKSVATADSSGFVDLAAFSATDTDWVEKALERARNGEDDLMQPSPSARGKKLAPLSLAPVSMTSLIEPQPERAGRPKRRTMESVVAAIVAACFVLGGAAIARSLLQRPSADTVVAAPQPIATTPAITATPTPTPTTEAAVATTSTPTGTTTSTPTTPPSGASTSPPRKPTAAGAHALPRPAAAPPKTGGAGPKLPPSPASGNSLDELIRRSVQNPSPKKPAK